MKVSAGHVVSMRFTMKNSKGEVIEDNLKKDPINYLQGSAGIQPILQNQLEGCKTGDKKMIYLLASSGLTKEDFNFEVIIDDIREASQEEIMLGYPIQLNKTKCEEDCHCYKIESF